MAEGTEEGARRQWLAGSRCSAVPPWRLPPDYCGITAAAPLSSHLPRGLAVPEMQRSDLSGAVLQLKSLGIDNIMTFEWLAPPPAEVRVTGAGVLRGERRGGCVQPVPYSLAVWPPVACLQAAPEASEER